MNDDSLSDSASEGRGEKEKEDEGEGEGIGSKGATEKRLLDQIQRLFA